MIVLIVIHLMIIIALVGVILLQKSEGGGLGIGSTGGFLSSRGTANVLTRTTAYLGLAFFATSLALSWLASAPLAPAGGGLLKELQGKEAPQGGTPAGGPQVPQSK